MVRRFDLHHNALAEVLMTLILPMPNPKLETYKLFGYCMLVDLSLGAEMWKKASVEISDALIHITMPLLIILMLPLPSAQCW